MIDKEKLRAEFREYLLLNESPNAVMGDWNGFSVKTERINKKGIEKNWKLLAEIDDEQHHKIYIYKCDGVQEYILGAWATESDEYKQKMF